MAGQAKAFYTLAEDQHDSSEHIVSIEESLSVYALMAGQVMSTYTI